MAAALAPVVFSFTEMSSLVFRQLDFTGQEAGGFFRNDCPSPVPEFWSLLTSRLVNRHGAYPFLVSGNPRHRFLFGALAMCPMRHT